MNVPGQVHHSCCTRRSGSATALPAQTRQRHVHDRRLPQEKHRHEAIGYVTPNDEHAGRGEDVRQARIEGLRRAHEERLAYHRRSTEERPEETP